MLPLLSLPSPGDPVLVEIGPFLVRWYGALIAIGILVAGRLAKRELERRGLSTDAAFTVGTWCIPAGIIGARLYHVATDWQRFSDDLASIPQLQEGGLGMPGVIIGGAIGAAIGARRAGLGVLQTFDVVAPGLILAQAIGRWGNWFNQELFGRPSDLPWALEIDPRHRPDRYADVETFHPTFLYESLWNVAVFIVLLRLARSHARLPAGAIFAAYLALYSLGRLFTESLRVDPAAEVAGIRFNFLLFAVVLVGASAWLAVCVRRTRREDALA